ncbi:MAG: hypothetical protein ACOVQ2_05345, partial [Flavobacterium sp.]
KENKRENKEKKSTAAAHKLHSCLHRRPSRLITAINRETQEKAKQTKTGAERNNKGEQTERKIFTSQT